MRGFDQIRLDRTQRRTLQLQLTQQLKALIQEGYLRPTERLPSTRALAEELSLSRNTITAAFERLHDEGYLQGSERSAFVVGTVTRAFRPGERRQAQAVELPPPRQLIAPRPFRPAQPDVNLFPMKLWNRYRLRALRRGNELLQYQSRFSMGLDELRQAVGAYLRDSRGIRCHWEEIAITGGSQQALFMLGQLLLGPERSAYMEDPGYPGAYRCWEQAESAVVPVPVDEEGICLPLPEARDSALIYVTPSHQFPLGARMSLGRRLELLQVARQRELWIVEDDYDSEFRFDSAPQPSLQSLDEFRRVIYVGSFSKTLFPGLRIGYVVLPPGLVEPFARLKSTLEDHGPLLDQATLSAFLESGAFDSHLRRCRRVYRERQQLFLELVKQKGLPLEFPITGHGMNLAAHFSVAADDAMQSTALAEAGLDAPALSSYCRRASRSGLLFGLTGFAEEEIRSGVETMSAVFARTFRAGNRSPA